jgi:hypothetical protein
VGGCEKRSEEMLRYPKASFVNTTAAEMSLDNRGRFLGEDKEGGERKGKRGREREKGRDKGKYGREREKVKEDEREKGK